MTMKKSMILITAPSLIICGDMLFWLQHMEKTEPHMDV